MDAMNSTRASTRPARWALLQGNVLWLSLVSLLNDAASEMIYPVLPFFLVGVLGATPVVLGTIEGIAESTASFLKLGSGWLSDRVRRRRPLILAGYAVAAAARPLIALVTAPWHVLAIRLSDRVGKGLRSAPRDALLAESAPPERRGAAFGIHRAADHAGAVIGPLLATGLLLLLPGRIRWVFLLAIIPGLLALLVILLRVRETPGAPPAGPRHPAGPRGLAGVRAALRGPLAGVLVVIVIFTLGNATDAFLLLRAQELGVPLTLIPLLWGLHHVSKVIWSLMGGALADRIGSVPSIVAGWLVYALTYAGFALAGTVWQAWALFLFYGLFYGLTEAPEKALIARLAAPGGRGSAFGAYHFAIGIAALPASVLFGALWVMFGAPTAFFVGAALALLSALLLPLVRLPRAEAPA